MSENKALPISRFPMEPILDLALAATTGTAPLDGRQVSPAVYMNHYMLKHPTQATDEGLAKKGFLGGTALGALSGLAPLAGGPVGVLAGAAAFWFVGSPSKNKVCTIMIVNQLEGALTLPPSTDSIGNPYLDHGIQTGHPAVCDPQGKKPPMSENQIPGKVQLDPDDPETLTSGVGFYRFEKDLGFLNLGVFGTAGAIALSSADPHTKGKLMGIAWNVPQKGELACAVTADLSKFPSLNKFYDETAGKTAAKSHSDSSAEYEIHCYFAARDFDSNLKTPASEDDFILTVSLQRGK